MNFHTSAKDKIKLENLELYKEDGLYYLKAKYCKENDRGVYEIDIPRIHLPVRQNDILLHSNMNLRTYCKIGTFIDLGFGELAIGMKDDIAYTIKTIEEKPRK